MTFRRAVSFAILILVVIGTILVRTRSDAPSTDRTLSTSVTQGGVRGLVVEPDDGREPVLDEIEAAESSIDLMIYLLTDARIIDALKAAEGPGVDVRVLLEEHPFGGSSHPEDIASELKRSGAQVR